MTTPLTGKRIVVCGYHWAGCKAVEIFRQAGAQLHVYTHQAGEGVPCVASYCRRIGVPFTLGRISADNLPFTPDLLASIYYRYLIKPEVISCVGRRIYNLHPSLLPKYRGCSSLTWAMVQNEATVGYTYHYVDAGFDTGDIILQNPIVVEPFDTQQTLYYRVMFQALQEIINVTQLVLSGFSGVPQQGEASYFKRGAPYSGVIDPSWTEAAVERFIRAMTFPPYPYATYLGSPVRTFEDYLTKRGSAK
jgi:methionyl-tRNA formyltransferase